MEWRGAAAAAAVAAAVSFFAAPSPLPAFLPGEEPPAYTVSTAAAVVLVEPVAHAPWIDVPAAPLAAGLAAAVAASLWTAVVQTGAGAGVAAVVLAAVLARDDVRALLALGAPSTLGLGALWASAVLLAQPRAALRPGVWGAALAAIASAAWPPLLVVLPVVVAGAGQSGWPAAAGVALSGVVGVAAGLGVWAARATRLSAESVAIADVLSAVADATPRAVDAFVWPPLGEVALPGVLAFAGVVALGRRVGAVTRRWFALAALTPIVVALAMPEWAPEIVRAVTWASWPLVGAGLAWVVAATPERRRTLAVAVCGVLLVAGGLAVPLAANRTAPEAFARRLRVALENLAAGQPVTVVADDTRLDTALVAWASGREAQRTRAVPRLVERAHAGGRLVLAAPSARAALELWGFGFAPRVTLDGPRRFALAAVTGRLRCVPVAHPWRELPGLEYTGRLGVHVPAGEGRLEAIVVGLPPLATRLVAPDGRAVGVLAAVTMDLPSLPSVLWPGDGRLPDASLTGVRIALEGRPDQAQSVSVALGQRAPLVAVRYVSPASVATVATVCAAPLARDEPAAASGVPLDDDTFFAGGWDGAVRSGGVVARDAGARAVTLLPASSGGSRTVALRSRPRPATTGWQLGLSVNGWTAAAQPMAAVDLEYRWSVPDGVWVAGTNEVVFEVVWTVPPPAPAPEMRGPAPGLTATSLRILRE